MRKIENLVMDQERALYGSKCLEIVNCSFDGIGDGESAIKECENITAVNCFFNLRYPFWHNDLLKIQNCKMTPSCRAALWYCNDVEIENTEMHGIKALRECRNIKIKNCDIISPEFGWSAVNAQLSSSSAESEYFMLRSSDIRLNDVEFSGKYSFQYVKRAVLENCRLSTKDAFWHGENIVVRNSVIKGEYLAWYSNNLTFENCSITGTQPFCYCRGLKLINCKMYDTDLCFEKSDVEAEITTPVKSIKNVRSGKITVPSVGEIISEDESGKCEIIDGTDV